MGGKATFVGLQPWLPWPLNRLRWWTEPVRAERLAALRIGLAACLLIDLFLTYLPNCSNLFGAAGLGAPPTHDWNFLAPRYLWSPLKGIENPNILFVYMLLWTAATVCLTLGLFTRMNAILVWVLSTSFANLNPYIDNAGDSIRGIMLLYLLLTPCGAVWSIDAWLRRRRARADSRLALLPWLMRAILDFLIGYRGRQGDRVFISPWALRLLFLQMVLIYFMNGYYKATGKDWVNGVSLYYVWCDLTLARWSFAQFPVPLWLTNLLSWTVLGWELAFPLLMAVHGLTRWICRLVPMPEWTAALAVSSTAWMRGLTLAFGASFHLGIAASLELGMFGPYMLCLYLPLLPWEWWVDWWRRRSSQVQAEIEPPLRVEFEPSEKAATGAAGESL